MPDPTLLIDTIILQESKNSSAIENIVTTQDELYKATLEDGSEQNHATKEVLSYRDALYVGLDRMKAGGGLILTDWVMYVLTAIAETSKITTTKIRKILSLKETLEMAVKEALGSSFNYELLEEMFALPYLKIGTLEKKKIAHRQTASSWLNKLSSAEILRPQKIGRTTYFINYRLMQILAN